MYKGRWVETEICLECTKNQLRLLYHILRPRYFQIVLRTGCRGDSEFAIENRKNDKPLVLRSNFNTREIDTCEIGRFFVHNLSPTKELRDHVKTQPSSHR